MHPGEASLRAAATGTAAACDSATRCTIRVRTTATIIIFERGWCSGAESRGRGQRSMNNRAISNTTAGQHEGTHPGNSQRRLSVTYRVTLRLQKRLRRERCSMKRESMCFFGGRQLGFITPALTSHGMSRATIQNLLLASSYPFAATSLPCLLLSESAVGSYRATKPGTAKRHELKGRGRRMQGSCVRNSAEVASADLSPASAVISAAVSAVKRSRAPSPCNVWSRNSAPLPSNVREAKAAHSPA